MSPQKQTLNELALFAGAGGGILAGKVLGWRTVCAVELDTYAASVLVARQNDGHLPPFPIWDDVRSFDGERWRGVVDVISGGFPCTDISSAGKRAGISGEHSGLWKEFARIIGEVRPRYVFIENSDRLRTNGLAVVLRDLAGLGFDAKWAVLGGQAVGAPHCRKRMWIVANANDGRQRDAIGGSKHERPLRPEPCESMANSSTSDPDDHWERARAIDAKVACASQPRGTHAAPDLADAYSKDVRLKQGRRSGPQRERAPQSGAVDWWTLDRIAGMDDALAHRVDRIRATGNGQISSVAVLAWNLLSGGSQ